ncbi:hypothetical protein, conserved [Angomonas deanei]|uniref:BspA type Leucine rich repeat region (6 copies) n=1 Tax=Angomonas deanei TaxID=59799 RepID=A0A7G2C9Q4_9TRYP|nr:hypothetical protein, conserved [Angomonas deanei]
MLRFNELYEYGSYFEKSTPLAFSAVSPCARERAESCRRGALGCTTDIVDGEAWRSLRIRSEECAARLESLEWWLTRPPAEPLKVFVELMDDEASLDTVALLEEFSVRLDRCGVHFLFYLKLNRIKTLEPFGTLVSRADEITLDRCSNLTSLYGLYGLRYLKHAYFYDCRITDISALRTCALLEAVSFCPCPSLTSLDALQDLQHLKSVKVWDCPVRSLDALRMCPSLERVVCRSSQAISLLPLEGLKCLKEVVFSGGNVVDFDVLHTCTALEVVDISGAADLISLDGLRSLPRLRELTIVRCGITSLDALHTCDALEELRVHSCSDLTSIEHFKGPPNLKDITIWCCPITSIRSLNTCVSLQMVDVTSCPLLLSLDGLGGLPNLEEVRANRSGITDVAAIAQCPALRYVDVCDCPQLQSVDVLLERGDVKVVYDK